MTFGERLQEAVRARGRFCVGIDPHPELLHSWGLPDNATGLERFARIAVEAVGAEVAVVKPQSAFFERHGSRGVAVLERTLAAAREAGALVLLDAKRGDIGSTMQAYADAYVDPSSPLCADAVTATPYAGYESLRPVLDTALAHGNGVFVVTLTSNPQGHEIQRARTAAGGTVAETILRRVRETNAAAGLPGSIGCVVGATIAPTGYDLDVGGPILAPGVGAQGAGPDDVRRVFGPALPAVLPSSSRWILRHGPDIRAIKDATRQAVRVFALLFYPESR